jgi:hypothetical protein
MNIATAHSARTFPSNKDILDFLDANRAPWNLWGRYGASRSVRDLIQYLREDQVAFRNGDTAGMLLDVNVAVVMVYYDDNGTILELVEECQVVHRTGACLERGYPGVGETMRKGELVVSAAMRALDEELDWGDPSKYRLSGLTKIEHRDKVESEKWPSINGAPGIYSVYHRHISESWISQELYDPSGYVQHEPDRDIIFKWYTAPFVPKKPQIRACS